MKSKKCVISKKTKHPNESDDIGRASYFSIFRYATIWDYFMIFIGVFSTLIKALAMPILIIIYGEFTTLLVDRTMRTGTSSKTIFLRIFNGGKELTNASVEENNQEIINDSISFGILLSILSIIQLVAGIFCVDSFNQMALRQITRIRINYFNSLMRQDIGWYDVSSSSDNFAVRITEDIEKIRDGIAEKVSHFLFLIMGFVICVIMSFVYGWKLSLVVVSYLPIVVITNTVIGRFQSSESTKELNSYSAAANVAEEVLSGIRTVFAFGGEKVEIERYNKKLIAAKRAVRLKGLLAGIGDGIMHFLYYGSNALGFWYGVQLVLNDRDKIDKEYTPAVLMIAFFGLITGADNISKTAPYLESFAAARGSAASIFKVIDRPSKIDSMSNDGRNHENFTPIGSVSFKNVHFNYPSRPDVQVLRGLNLDIKSGQSVAIVGNSGNGKSTCLQLLQRFYDPDEGEIMIDDVDIRSINVNVLRSSIATVGQEPILFSTTIGENIRYGKPDATDNDVVAAAQNSGAHDFIARLPQGYNTLVGEKGSQLSGGQKQRIAIARALIQNPKILLLDEATSALDYQSEKYVQKTLDRASRGRTTITVSHRLSAIRSADRIVFIDKGVIIEDGTHSELMAEKGQYYNMISAGMLDDGDESPLVDTPDIESPNKTIEKPFFAKNDDENYFRTLSVDEMEKGPAKSSEGVHFYTVFKRVMKIIKPEWFIMFLATISALIIGTSLPIFAILFAEVYGALSLQNASEALNQVYILCAIFLALGIVTLVAAIAQTYWFSKTSINLTTRMRSMCFASLMRQECGWFDQDDHSSAALSARLTGDAGNLQSVIGFPLSVILQSTSTFILGIVVSMNYSVKLAFVCLASVPLSLLFVVLESKNMSKTAVAEKELTEKGTKIASEAVNNIRTVASLRQEKYMIARYVQEMTKVESVMHKKIIWRGCVSSISQSIPFFAYAIALTYGGFMVAWGEIHFKNVIKVTEAILYGIMVITQSLVFVPNFTTAFVGAFRLFQIIDREPMIRSPNISNKSRLPDKSNDIQYKKIDFHYPTRPDVQILKDFNLSVDEGKTIALVGPSGCGKSTCIQLLQRLYDPERGRVFIGLDEISSDITLKNLRAKLSIVSQEPVLFDKSIAENIAYGDNSRAVSMDEIIEAAKVANVHNFIVQLPMGYETNVGKTAQLSGGQRQRIAIARAMVRNPQILLLDEATSSLDLHSEQVVQQALDSARSGRTCLIIAHRLSTVQNADEIYVLRSGNIVEHGTHNELLALRGIYARLHKAQR